MPRGFTQENFDVLNERLRLLSLPTERFLNTNVVAIGGVVNYVASVRAFRPKALQLHYFKNACPQIPNSLFELFFDVSPALISFVNTNRDPYMGVDSDNLDIAELPSTMAEFEIAFNMAYCLGFMGISEDNNNLPQLRQPRSSDIREVDFIRLKNTILDGFEKGYSDDLIYGGAPPSEPIAEMEFSEQYALYRDEQEENETYPMEYEDWVVGFRERQAVMGEVDEVVEEVVEETPVEISDITDIYTMPIVEGSSLSAQYLSGLALSRADFNEIVNGGATAEQIYATLTVAQRLLEMGYSRANIKSFLNRLSYRNFAPKNIVIESRNFGTYAVVNIRKKLLDGTGSENESTPTRFNSSTYRRDILSMLLTGEDAETLPSNLRPVRFTGGGNTGRAIQGALAVPQLASGFAITTTTTQVKERYDRAFLQSGLSPQPTTQAQTTTGTDDSGYSLIGYQFADSGRLYSRENSLYAVTNVAIEREWMTENKVFVFYFIATFEGRYRLKKLQWGKLNDYPPSDINFLQYDSLNLFITYLQNNDRLSTPNTIKLTDVYANSVDEFLRKVNDMTRRGRWKPTFSNRVTGEINLSQERFRALNVQAIIDTLPSQASTQVSSVEATNIGNSSMSESNTVGFEFEGGHARLGMRELARQYNQKGISINAEGYNHITRPKWKLVPDGSLSGVPNAFELVSPVLTGSQGIESLRECLKVSQELGVQIFQEGGVHIHFGNSNWDLRVRKNILLNQYKMSKWFQATQPSHRRNIFWARPYSSFYNTYTSFKQKVQSSSNESELTRNVAGTDSNNRYREVNITNTRQPTWEWRFPQGNIEVDTNINMVRLIDRLIEVSKIGVLGNDNLTEEGMKEWMGIDLYTFWRNRIYDLSQTGRTGRPSYNHSDLI